MMDVSRIPMGIPGGKSEDDATEASGKSFTLRIFITGFGMILAAAFINPEISEPPLFQRIRVFFKNIFRAAMASRSLFLDPQNIHLIVSLFPMLFSSPHTPHVFDV